MFCSDFVEFLSVSFVGVFCRSYKVDDDMARDLRRPRNSIRPHLCRSFRRCNRGRRRCNREIFGRTFSMT